MRVLEELIRRRQDELRGRPEDWIDRFAAWCYRRDWIGVAIIATGVIGELVVLVFLLWH